MNVFILFLIPNPARNFNHLGKLCYSPSQNGTKAIDDVLYQAKIEFDKLFFSRKYIFLWIWKENDRRQW